MVIFAPDIGRKDPATEGGLIATMRGPKPRTIELTPRLEAVLTKITRRANSPQFEVQRTKMILAAAAGANNQQVADCLEVDRRTVRKWRQRWADATQRLNAAAAEVDDRTLNDLVREVLRDEHRSGAPGKFSAEQVSRIIALACEAPEAYGRPVTHWTPVELADEAVKQGMVSEISPRSVGRFLKWAGVEAPSVALLAEQ